MALEVVVRRFGNSFGVILPAEFIKERDIHAKERVLVEVVKEADLRSVFKTLKAKVSGQDFKDTVREGWK